MCMYESAEAQGCVLLSMSRGHCMRAHKWICSRLEAYAKNIADTRRLLMMMNSVALNKQRRRERDRVDKTRNLVTGALTHISAGSADELSVHSALGEGVMTHNDEPTSGGTWDLRTL